MGKPDEQVLGTIRQELKELLVTGLVLEELEPQDIADDEVLFGEGVGLDSLDAVEIVVLLERNYGIRIEDVDDVAKIFQSVRTLATFVYEESHLFRE